MANEEQQNSPAPTSQIQEIRNGEFEVLVTKQFGGGEQIVVRTRCASSKDVRSSVKELYNGVIKDRADTFATETANYQLKMSGVNRVLDEEELLEKGREEEAKKGTK